jgi:hypothetical protein
MPADLATLLKDPADLEYRIMVYFDELFLAGDFEQARLDVEAVNTDKLTPGEIVAILAATGWARSELGEMRSKLVARAEASLLGQWKTPQARVDRLLWGLR